MTKKLILVLVSLWWGWTAIIDFAIVPTVFRTISDFFNAGELGIALFSKLNILEVSIGLLLIILSTVELMKNKTKRQKIYLGMISLCWMISLMYFFWLTPKIAELRKSGKKLMQPERSAWAVSATSNNFIKSIMAFIKLWIRSSLSFSL